MIINGKAYWAKIVGKPVDGYKNQYKEWSFDLAIDKDTASMLKKQGLGKYLKNNDDDRGTYIHLRRKAKKKDGTDSKPIKIVDHRGNDWDNRLIGNGSELNVNVGINEFDGNLTLSPVSVQVWNLVPYIPKGQFPTREDDEVTVPEDSAETKEW